MRTDRDGRLYVATKMGVQFCDQAGRVNGIVPTPNGVISNLCFGGPDMKTAFIMLSSTGRLVALDWPRPGLRLNWSELALPPQPKES